MLRDPLAPAPVAVLLVSLAWLAAVGLAPLVGAAPEAWPSPVRAAAGVAYVAGARVCTGLYLGAALGLGIVVLAAGFARRTIDRGPSWLVAAALPTVASVGAEWIGLGSPMWTRAAESRW